MIFALKISVAIWLVASFVATCYMLLPKYGRVRDDY